jgi:hypothetical protein
MLAIGSYEILHRRINLPRLFTDHSVREIQLVQFMITHIHIQSFSLLLNRDTTF